MVIYDKYITDSGIERVKAYSDKSVMIERDGTLYSEADDFAYQNRKYTETDIPAESEPTPVDEVTEQKAEAYDYLTGRGDRNE